MYENVNISFTPSLSLCAYGHDDVELMVIHTICDVML